MSMVVPPRHNDELPPYRGNGEATLALSAESPSFSRYFAWKRWLDLVLAILLLIPGIPLILLLVLVVRLTSRGSGLYRQVRVGRNGELFTMYKIRTMRHDAEVGTGAVWAEPADPRVTRTGRFLRWKHLDELPQLLNVLCGHMSLVGPRPERPEFVRHLSRHINDYLDRLAVPPGITGLAQINLLPDSDLESVRRKLAVDLNYIERANWFLDVRILLGTSIAPVSPDTL